MTILCAVSPNPLPKTPKPQNPYLLNENQNCENNYECLEYLFLDIVDERLVSLLSLLAPAASSSAAVQSQGIGEPRSPRHPVMNRELELVP